MTSMFQKAAAVVIGNHASTYSDGVFPSVMMMTVAAAVKTTSLATMERRHTERIAFLPD